MRNWDFLKEFVCSVVGVQLHVEEMDRLQLKVSRSFQPSQQIY